MKIFVLFCILFPAYLFESSTGAHLKRIAGNTTHSDTCFYELRLPADMDMPSTPHYDTTIVRNSDCKVHLLKLQSWGTETEYQLGATIDEKSYNRQSHFFMGPNGGSRFIDITELPAGNYSGYLLACGNGGSFGLAIR